ncbi:MAG TPA: MarR family transcriptional regulator [Bacteroidales bacterium]|nr:MarR family transcriptional regulator [Bacteroidales bacterium]
MEYTEILINIRKILRSLNLESKKIQKSYGVSIPQLMCLDYLGQKEDLRSTQIDIARYLNLNASTMSGIIDRLEGKGFVARLPNPDDKRTIFIALTSKGARLLEESPQLLHHQLSKRLKKLPNEKLVEINQALKILVESLDIEEIPASPIVTIEDPISNNTEDQD